MEDLTGVRAVEILGSGNYAYAIPFYGDRRPMLLDLVFTEDRRIESWDYTRIERSRNSLSAETTVMKPKGRTLTLKGVAAPIYDESGEIAGVIESLSDVTDLRRREHALHDTLSRYQAILDYTGSATAIIEEDSTISYINPEFEKITGYVKEEIEGKKKWMDFVIPEDVDRMLLYQSRIGQTNAPHTGEFRFIWWDGQVRNGYVTLAVIPDMKRSSSRSWTSPTRSRRRMRARGQTRSLNFFSAITRHEILNQADRPERKSRTGPCTGTRSGLHGRLWRRNWRHPMPSRHGSCSPVTTRISGSSHRNGRMSGRPSAGGVPGSGSERSISMREIRSVEVYADKLLERVFFHLVDNAVRYGEKSPDPLLL